MEIFQLDAERLFLKRVVAYVQLLQQDGKTPKIKSHEAPLSLPQAVSDYLQEAKSLGITTEYALAAFVIANIYYHPNLSASPFFRRVMRNTRCSADDNMETILSELVTKEMWKI